MGGVKVNLEGQDGVKTVKMEKQTIRLKIYMLNNKGCITHRLNLR